jgi:hypothetical protein
MFIEFLVVQIEEPYLSFALIAMTETINGIP